jgi:DNA-binding FadR family transcriptional regulator
MKGVQRQPGIQNRDDTMTRQLLSDVSAVIKSEITQKIETGLLKAGQKLSTERELARSYAASRTAIRRGLAELEKGGWITRRVGRGTFVADRTALRFPGERLIEVSPADLATARGLIEPSIAEYAAVHATEMDLRSIHEIMRTMEQQVDDALEYELLDGKLHASIAAATHNRFVSLLYNMIDEVRKTPGWVGVTVATSIPGRRKIHTKDHRTIVEALFARDSGLARESMRRHIQRVIQFMLG